MWILAYLLSPKTFQDPTVISAKVDASQWTIDFNWSLTERNSDLILLVTCNQTFKMIRHLWAVTSLVTKALKFTTHSYDETIETTTKDGSVESDGIIRNVSLLNSAKRTAAPHAFKIRWKILFFIIFLHVSAVYGVWLMLTSAQWKTFIFSEGKCHIIPKFLLIYNFSLDLLHNKLPWINRGRSPSLCT